MSSNLLNLFISLSITLGVSLKFVAVALLVVAAGLTWATVWFWRTARPEPESLAPLEIMSQREFASADEDSRKKMLNSVRAVPVIDASQSSIETK